MASGSRKPRRRLQAVGLLVGLLFSIVMSELLLRALDIPTSRPFFQELYFRNYNSKLMCYDSDPTGAFDIDLDDPSQRARFEELASGTGLDQKWRDTPHAVYVEYNSRGFREREDLTPRDGVRRIVVVGDSFTYGHGLPEHLSYPRQLESSLRAASPSPVEVLNCGAGGQNLDRLAGIMQFALVELQAETLVYGYLPDDVLPADAPEARGERKGIHPALDSAWLHVEQTADRFALGVREPGPSHLVDLLLLARERRATQRDTLAWYREIHEPDNWQKTGQLLVAIDRHARRQGTRFVVALLPLIVDVGDDYPLAREHARISAFLHTRRIEYVDCLPPLAAHADEELMLHPHDRHPSPLYARIVAQTLASRLASPAPSTRRE